MAARRSATPVAGRDQQRNGTPALNAPQTPSEAQPFAFIIHPIDVRRDAARRYPIAQYLPERAIEWFLKSREPLTVADLTGIRSATGRSIHGWLIACPLSPRQFLELPVDEVYRKLEKCGHIAEQLGAGIVGLGAFTSVVGDGGITLAKRLNIAVTTGNSYTVATAVEGTLDGARLLEIDIPNSTAAIVGATGSIGATCAELLARSVASVNLVGRSEDKLASQADRLSTATGKAMRVYTDVAKGLADADLVITVSSAAKAIVLPEHIKSGAVVCDVARPRDVSVAVARERNDVLVIEGGVVRVPGEMRCRKHQSEDPFSFGFPQGTSYACMSETMALALEGRMESFTLGKEVSVEQVDGISDICRRHGFKLDGYRSFERVVDQETIQSILAAIRTRRG